MSPPHKVRCSRLTPFVTIWCRRSGKLTVKESDRVSQTAGREPSMQTYYLVVRHITQQLARKQAVDGLLV